MTITDTDLKEIVSEFRAGILGERGTPLMCFAVCAPLQAYLSVIGIETKLVEGDFGEINHYWLEMKDGRIIDPTADQFFILWGINEMPPVYIGEKPEWYS